MITMTTMAPKLINMGLLLSLTAGLTTVSQDGGRETRARRDGGSWVVSA
jgi:hypothetical protein